MERDQIAALMRQYGDAWTRGDAEAAMAFWADDVIHHVPGRSRLAGDWAGKEAFLAAYGAIFDELNGTIEVVEFHDLLIGERFAASFVRERAVRGDRTLDFDRVVLYRIANGKIAETWSYDFDPYALDAFWA
jgi:uncharacterized protein (TIGR02246 family)